MDPLQEELTRAGYTPIAYSKCATEPDCLAIITQESLNVVERRLKYHSAIIVRRLKSALTCHWGMSQVHYWPGVPFSLVREEIEDDHDD